MRLAKMVLLALVANTVSAHAATVVVSGGNTMAQSASGEERRLSSLRVDCASYNRTSVGFLCAFDDGQRTILQFEEREGMPVRLFDAEGREIIGVRRVGSYHVLPQLYSTVFARVGNKEAAIVRNTARGSGYAMGERTTATSPAGSPAAPVSQNAAGQNRAIPSPSPVPAQPVAASSVAQAAAVGSVAMKPEQMKRDWVLRTSYATLEEALIDFASRVDYEVIYENRELHLNLKRDMPIARGADFWEMLGVLGEAYRKSDAAFQIIPTKFKQIVVVPMGQMSTAAAATAAR